MVNKEFTYPDGVGHWKDKIKWHSGQVGQKLGRIEKVSTKYAVTIGRHLLAAESLFLKNGRKRKEWGRFRGQAFPGLEARTSQRYMQLAEYVDLKKYPNIGSLGQALLLKIIPFARGKPVGEFLREKGVTLDFDPKKKSALASLKKGVTQVLAQSRQEANRQKADVEKSRKGERQENQAPTDLARQLVHQVNDILKILAQVQEDEDLLRELEPRRFKISLLGKKATRLAKELKSRGRGA